MMSTWKRLLRERREHARFRTLPRDLRSIVFYSENEGYWQHLRPIIQHITDELQQHICYVTSSETDPILKGSHDRIHAFYVGDGIVRTSFFLRLDADVMVMTMPDLETYHIKRSKVANVHYVYVFHSIVSTHMIYREKAFDHFDTIFAVGPHHEAEVRATEEVYGLKAKSLLPHGSGRLDTILDENRNRPTLPAPATAEQTRVIVAPSWGPEGLIETRGAELAEILLQGGYDVTFRPHPMTVKKWPQSIDVLRQFEGRKGFRLELDVSGQQSLYASHLMICDWSGAAYEFAFGLERPVLFIDVPRKVNNPAYEKISHIPLEVSIRDRIGEVVSASELAKVGPVIDRLCSDPDMFQERIRRERDAAVYNVSSSGAVGADAILTLARRAHEAGA